MNGMIDLERFVSSSEAETFSFGQKVGASLQHPVILGLFGELGTGKTMFVRGLCAGIGVPRSVPITSPAYQLINVYPGGRFTVVHADAYRLAGPESFEELGVFEAADSPVIVVEWAGRVEAALPGELIKIEFHYLDGDRREIRFPTGWLRND